MRWDQQAERHSWLATYPKWAEMTDLVDDRMLETFAVDCSETGLPEKLWIRYNGIVQRINLYKPFWPVKNGAFWKDLTSQFGAIIRKGGMETREGAADYEPGSQLQS